MEYRAVAIGLLYSLIYLKSTGGGLGTTEIIIIAVVVSVVVLLVAIVIIVCLIKKNRSGDQKCKLFTCCTCQ